MSKRNKALTVFQLAILSKDILSIFAGKFGSSPSSPIIQGNQKGKS